MSYEIKRWKLAIAYGSNTFAYIILMLLTIGLLFLCFLFSQIPAALPLMVLIVASFTPSYILMHYSHWQKLFQLYNSAWWINIDNQGIHVKKLFGHDHIKWQELSKVEKQFVIPSRLVFKLEPGSHRKTFPFLYKLETSSGQRVYIPEEMARSGTIVEQIKTKTNEAGVKLTFVLPANPPLLSRNMTALLIAGVIPIITGCAWLIIFAVLLKSQSQEYRYGFIDKTGKLVIPARFDKANDFSKYGTTVKIGDKWGCIDKSGHLIIQPTFNDECDLYLGDGSSDLIRVNVNGKAGFMDWHGKQVIKQQFDAADAFYDGVADIQLEKKWGCINKCGKIIVKPIFDHEVNRTYDGKGHWFPIYKGHVVCIDRAGKILFKTPYADMNSFSEGISAVELNHKTGYIDESWKIICQPKYDAGGDFHEGLAWVNSGQKIKHYKDAPDDIEVGKEGYIDRSGQLVIPIQFLDADDFSGGLALVRSGPLNYWWPKFDNWGYIDHKGNYVVKAELLMALSLKDGLAAVQESSGKWGYIDKTGTRVIKPSFDWAKDFSEGLAPVLINHKYGYIDKTGHLVIPAIFDQAEGFSQGLARVGFAKALVAKK